MTFIYGPTMDHARNHAHDLGLRPSQVTLFGNQSRSKAGWVYSSEDVIHILPGTSNEQRTHIMINITKTRNKPLVVDHECS